jgi:hypothetical protein
VTTSPVQATTPAFSLARLRATLAVLKAEQPERGYRWTHAAAIVALRTIEPGATAGYWVQSECDDRTRYWVLQVPSGNWTCSCPDYAQRGGPCKHALAVQLFEACQAVDYGDADILDLDLDAPIPFELTEQAEFALGLRTGEAACPHCGRARGVVYDGERTRCFGCWHSFIPRQEVYA